MPGRNVQRLSGLGEWLYRRDTWEAVGATPNEETIRTTLGFFLPEENLSTRPGEREAALGRGCGGWATRPTGARSRCAQKNGSQNTSPRECPHGEPVSSRGHLASDACYPETLPTPAVQLSKCFATRFPTGKLSAHRGKHTCRDDGREPSCLVEGACSQLPKATLPWYRWRWLVASTGRRELAGKRPKSSE